jgi:hypothetical protein
MTNVPFGHEHVVASYLVIAQTAFYSIYANAWKNGHIVRSPQVMICVAFISMDFSDVTVLQGGHC